jgi:hypothetical protein
MFVCFPESFVHAGTYSPDDYYQIWWVTMHVNELNWGSSKITLWVGREQLKFKAFVVKLYSIQHYVIKFVSDLRQVRGFLWVLRLPPPIKHRHDITKILFKVTLNTINQPTNLTTKALNFNCSLPTHKVILLITYQCWIKWTKIKMLQRNQKQKLNLFV